MHCLSANVWHIICLHELGVLFLRRCENSAGTKRQLAWSEGRRPPGALTYICQDEPGELSQWL